MVILRTIFRLIVFIIAIGAIVVILGAGYWAFSNQTAEAAASISIGDESMIRSPGSAEDFLMGLYLQYHAETINTPISDDPSPVPFTVEIGETAVSISQKLEDQGFIRDADIFRRFLSYNNLDSSLEAGDYELHRSMTMREIAEVLQKANFEEVVVTIPEGLRAEEIAEILDEQNIMDGDVFLAFVRNGVDLEHPLLVDRPSSVLSYEGYLFPDTYRLPLNATPEDLVTRMLDNMASKIFPNALELAAGQGYSFYEILTVASIVEREAVIPGERPLIASVYLNRIREGMYLQADPTVQYAMGYQTDTDQWWKTPVTLEEYSSVDVPYNTYLYPGLPPGPIANPGAASINATLQPEQSNYLFFMGCGGQGAHIFAEDFATHEQNVAACQ
jgi:UPF0755 protein